MINQAYPSASPLATFPATLLEVMPKLPDILEYRLLSEGLILRDVKANIIVDFIPDVYSGDERCRAPFFDAVAVLAASSAAVWLAPMPRSPRTSRFRSNRTRYVSA